MIYNKVRQNVIAAGMARKARKQFIRNFRHGVRTDWKVSVDLYGLSKERREEILEALLVEGDASRLPRRDLDHLYSEVVVRGAPRGVAIEMALNMFSRRFDKAGLTRDEAKSAEMTVSSSLVEESPVLAKSTFADRIKARAATKMMLESFAVSSANAVIENAAGDASSFNARASVDGNALPLKAEDRSGLETSNSVFAFAQAIVRINSGEISDLDIKDSVTFTFAPARARPGAKQ